MSISFGLPGSRNCRRTTHTVDGVKVVVQQRSYHGGNNGFFCFIEGERFYVNRLTRDEAATIAVKRYKLTHAQ